MEVNDTGLGGIKEAVILIKGKGAYSRLKYESGAHRVQRVPETESSGRIHTSAATVAVLPEVDDVEVDLNPNDVRVDVYLSLIHIFRRVVGVQRLRKMIISCTAR